MYADFEFHTRTYTRSIKQPTSIFSQRSQHTHPIWMVHTISRFTYGEDKNSLMSYRGKDCVSKFCEHIVAEACRLYSSFPELPMEPLTKSQVKKYNQARKCHICFGPFKPKDREVRDHCHYTGKYRGAAHSLSNLQYKIPNYIPVVFDNLAG